MSNIEVDFVGRGDMKLKSGGDTLQMEHYIRLLEPLGVDCRLIQYSPRMEIRDSAIVHLVNTARPYDLLDAFRQVSGHRMVVSPIHHSLVDITSMRRAEPGAGLRTVVGKVANESMRELIATAARQYQSAAKGEYGNILRSGFRNIPLSRGLWKRVGTALDNVDFVLTLSETERDCLRRDTGWGGRNECRIPNGVPFVRPSQGTAWADRSSVLLSVGRIEPRKRQLELAKVCATQGIRIDFVGSPNHATPNYVKEFKELVTDSPLLTWHGEKSGAEVISLMENSRVFVNPSWVEVQSLVDIEAHTAGCVVYSSRTGSTKEYFPESTEVFELSDLAALVTAAAKRASDSNPTVPESYPHTWDGAVAELSRVYTNLVAL